MTGSFSPLLPLPQSPSCYLTSIQPSTSLHPSFTHPLHRAISSHINPQNLSHPHQHTFYISNLLNHLYILDIKYSTTDILHIQSTHHILVHSPQKLKTFSTHTTPSLSNHRPHHHHHHYDYPPADDALAINCQVNVRCSDPGERKRRRVGPGNELGDSSNSFLMPA